MFKKLGQNKWVKWIGIVLASLLLLFFGFYASIYIGLWGKIPTTKDLAELKQSQATQVYDHDSELIGKYYIYDRESIKYKDLPQNLINALVATEDARFYKHDGVDNRSLLRVFFKTILLSDKSSGGGSTITLQLAKNLYGRKDYGALGIVVNKLKESFVAKRLEEIYSKQEILTMYFNTVPFSDNTYGIESAAHKFFDKPTYELNLSEAATLVGTLKANHSYNPRLFPERSQLRRDVVLTQMVKYQYISQEKASASMRKKIELDYHYYATNQGLAPYFREHVKRQVQKLLKDKKYRKPDGSKYDIYNDGLKVYTTLDAKMQGYAEEAMHEHMSKLQELYEKAYGKYAPWKKEKILKQAEKRIPDYKKWKKAGLSDAEIQDSLSLKKNTDLFNWEESTVEKVSVVDSLQHYLKFLNTGLLSVNPKNGAIRAYIGGIDFRYFKYDHVYQSKRQVGSTFKPFVYTAALESGMDACTYFPMKAVTYTDVKDWTPKNASSKDDPDLNYSLKYALSHSVNTIAVKVLNKTGINNVVKQAHKMGIESELPSVPSLALGTCDLKVSEMAKAYTSFLNQSKPVTPFAVTRIEDKNGNLIAEFNKEKMKSEEMAFSDATRQTMLEMMKATVDDGTARRLRSTYGLGNSLAGKTGTTQNNKDGWFVGMLPNLVTVIWVGNDDHRIGFSSTSLGQGANSALPIFGLMMQKLNADDNFNALTNARFERPTKDVLASLDCPDSERDGFFKRLFGSKKKKKEFHEEMKTKKKKKGGFFSFLRGKKNKDKDN